jgi:hypothetical protein
MEVHVDKRVELFSILFHLVGGKGYVGLDTPYRHAVDAWFGKFAGHPAVQASRELRQTHGISFNAPVSLAVFVDPDTLQPLTDLGNEDELDARWKGVPIRAYLDQVRAFSVDTNAAGFFAQQAPYIGEVEKRLASTLIEEKIDEWFEKVIKVDATETFIVVPGLMTGPWNYEAQAHDDCGRQSVYQVVELEGAEKGGGLPAPTRTTTELVAHEMAHSFVNPVIEKHADILVPAAQPLFERVKVRMGQQGYVNAKIMIEESLVRAILAFFARDKEGGTEASNLVDKDRARGFTWIPELTRWLAQQGAPLQLEKLMPGFAQWWKQQAAAVQA